MADTQCDLSTILLVEVPLDAVSTPGWSVMSKTDFGKVFAKPVTCKQHTRFKVLREINLEHRTTQQFTRITWLTLHCPLSLNLVGLLFSIQINSKKIFKDGDPVTLQLIFPGAIQTCKQMQQLFIHIYKTTQLHRTITGQHYLHFHTKTLFSVTLYYWCLCLKHHFFAFKVSILFNISYVVNVFISLVSKYFLHVYYIYI